MLPVLTITLNPALDVTTTIDRLKPLQKLRCAEPRLDPGAGGVNVPRAPKELRGEGRPFAAIARAVGADVEALRPESGVGRRGHDDFEAVHLGGDDVDHLYSRELLVRPRHGEGPRL